MIIVWNARGAAGLEFGNAVKELKKRFKPNIIILVETRCSGDNAKRAIRRMGFCHHVMVEAEGMSGGIWIMWHKDEIQIKTIVAHKQFLHCEVEGLGKIPWIFTAIYASPREHERYELWENIKLIAEDVNVPWLLAGDFNDIKDAGEQRGGSRVNERKCNKFWENINHCKLIDLGSEGPSFTWRGPIIHTACRLYKRLDRAICNKDGRNMFGEAFVRVGLRVQSDHHPLLIFLESTRSNKEARPFRFKAAWMTQEFQ